MAAQAADAIEADFVGDATPWDMSDDGARRLREALNTEYRDARVEILIEAARRMALYRGNEEIADARRRGSVMYQIAWILYESRLRFTEDQICELLTVARHSCGHGIDTRPPFDLARNYQRAHGYSPKLAKAIRFYVENLPPAITIHVKEIKASAALLSLVDPDLSDLRGAAKKRWINQVRAAMTEIPYPERSEWQQLVVAMTCGGPVVMPKRWQIPAQRLVDNLGAAQVLDRLEEWWPRPVTEGTVSLEGYGKDLLKHFIWLLGLLPYERGEVLVAGLDDVNWKSRPLPVSVLKVAAAFLEHAQTAKGAAARSAFLSALDLSN